MKWHAAMSGFLTCLFCLAARADVPPEPGYLRQTVSITFDTKDDVSDYRFFIESPMRIDEIKIAKGEPSVVDGTGHVGSGEGWYAMGHFSKDGRRRIWRFLGRKNLNIYEKS